MKQEDAESLARVLDKRLANGRHIADHDIRPLVDFILSGDMKREIENAAYKQARDTVCPMCALKYPLGENGYHIMPDRANSLRCAAEGIPSLIRPPAQRSTND